MIVPSMTYVSARRGFLSEAVPRRTGRLLPAVARFFNSAGRAVRGPRVFCPPQRPRSGGPHEARRRTRHHKAHMETMDIFKQNAGRGLPKRTFKDKMTIGRGADQIDLYYFGPGHTNGDAW